MNPQRERDPLPTKEQLEAITDVPALQVLRDEIADRITRMETDLEFRTDADIEWEHRARGALYHHRVARKHIDRRIRELGSRTPTAANVRPAARISNLTREALVERSAMDPTSFATIAEVDQALNWLAARVDAVCSDRDDEIAVPTADRDHVFVARSGDALRHLRTLRQAAQRRRGEISRAAKLAGETVREFSRERLFIDVAREVLDKATYLSIWDRVDVREVVPAK